MNETTSHHNCRLSVAVLSGREDLLGAVGLRVAPLIPDGRSIHRIVAPRGGRSGSISVRRGAWKKKKKTSVKECLRKKKKEKKVFECFVNFFS